MIDIGLRMKEIRDLYNLSANRLSQILEVDPSTISKIETGKALPSIQLLIKFCDNFDITLGKFFADTHTTDLPLEVRRVIERVKKLPTDKLKVLESVLDTWVDSDVEKNEREKKLGPKKRPLTQKVYEYPDKERNKLYFVAETSKEYDKIDVRSTLMAAHLEDAESIPLTPELEDIIEDGIRESRQLKREREAKLEQEKKEGNNKATTDNE